MLRENLPGPVTVGPDREGLHILMEGAIGNSRNRLPAVRSLDADAVLPDTQSGKRRFIFTATRHSLRSDNFKNRNIFIRKKQ